MRWAGRKVQLSEKRLRFRRNGVSVLLVWRFGAQACIGYSIGCWVVRRATQELRLWGESLASFVRVRWHGNDTLVTLDAIGINACWCFARTRK